MRCHVFYDLRIVFDNVNTDEITSVNIPESEMIRDINSIIVVRPEGRKGVDRLSSRLESMGKNVKTVFAKPEE